MQGRSSGDEKADRAAFGREIKALRGKRSQEWLAALVAQHTGKKRRQTWVSAVERGDAGVSPDDVRAFARALSVEYNRLAVLVGFVEEVGQSRESTLDEQIAADLLAFAAGRPELMATLRRLKVADDQAMYRDAMRIIGRFLVTSLETVRESNADGEADE